MTSSLAAARPGFTCLAVVVVEVLDREGVVPAVAAAGVAVGAGVGAGGAVAMVTLTVAFPFKAAPKMLLRMPDTRFGAACA